MKVTYQIDGMPPGLHSGDVVRVQMIEGTDWGNGTAAYRLAVVPEADAGRVDGPGEHHSQLDKSQQRMLGNLVARHRDTALSEIRKLQENAGYLLRDIEAGRIPTYESRSVLSSAQEIVARLAALDAIRDAKEIVLLEKEDTP